MSKRIALFAGKEEIENYFNFTSGLETIFSPHYNLAPGQHILALFFDGEKVSPERARWGLGDGEPDSMRPIMEVKDALKGLKDGTFKRCILPVSGFYLWKEAGKRSKYPFFVRMLHNTLMALAGVSVMEKQEDGRAIHTCAILQSESNALIQPLEPLMPLQCTRELANEWLMSERTTESLVEEMKGRYMMTELTVHRVSDKVNDISANSPKLIQPLPK